MTASYNREQIRAALTETDDRYTNYLDLETGNVIRINAEDPADEAISNEVFAGYGDRYRYIPGGNTTATEADVQTWLEAEGL